MIVKSLTQAKKLFIPGSSWIISSSDGEVRLMQVPKEVTIRGFFPCYTIQGVGGHPVFYANFNIGKVQMQDFNVNDLFSFRPITKSQFDCLWNLVS